MLPRRFQLPVALRVDLLLTAGEHVLRRDVADGTVQADKTMLVLYLFELELPKLAVVKAA